MATTQPTEDHPGLALEQGLYGFIRFIPFDSSRTWGHSSRLLPLALRLAVFLGWFQPALVVGLFFVLEFVTSMVMERHGYTIKALRFLPGRLRHAPMLSVSYVGDTTDIARSAI